MISNACKQDFYVNVSIKYTVLLEKNSDNSGWSVILPIASPALTDTKKLDLGDGYSISGTAIAGTVIRQRAQQVADKLTRTINDAIADGQRNNIQPGGGYRYSATQILQIKVTVNYKRSCPNPVPDSFNIDNGGNQPIIIDNPIRGGTRPSYRTIRQYRYQLTPGEILDAILNDPEYKDAPSIEFGSV